MYRWVNPEKGRYYARLPRHGPVRPLGPHQGMGWAQQPSRPGTQDMCRVEGSRLAGHPGPRQAAQEARLLPGRRAGPGASPVSGGDLEPGVLRQIAEAAVRPAPAGEAHRRPGPRPICCSSCCRRSSWLTIRACPWSGCGTTPRAHTRPRSVPPAVGKRTRVLPEAAGRATDATRSGYLRGAWSRLALGADVFTGALWTCAQARDLGLIDSLGGAGMVARDVVGAEAQVDYLPVRDPSEGLVGHLATVLAEHGYFSALVAVSSLQSETWVRIGNRQCRLPDGLQCICLHWTAVGSTTPFKYQPFPSLVAISPVQSET